MLLTIKATKPQYQNMTWMLSTIINIKPQAQKITCDNFYQQSKLPKHTIKNITYNVINGQRYKIMVSKYCF